MVEILPEDLLTFADDDIAAVGAVDVEPDDEETAMEDRLQFPWQLQ